MNFTINSPLSANIYSFIRDDNRLQAGDKLLLYTIIDHINNQGPIELDISILSRETALEEKEIKNSLQQLMEFDWLNKVEAETYRLQSPREEKHSDLLVKNWPKIFGTRQLTPFTYRKLQAFVEDGMEEELIIEIMKISAEQATGNPLNYCLKILSDLRNEDIKTLKQFLRKRREKNGQQIPGRTGKNKNETKRKSLEELYRKGYQ